jgi:hypothetical protein
MSAASAPTPPTYDVCTPARWDDWYKAIGVLGDGGTDFGLLETVGQELRTMKVPFAEGWGDTLNDLQMGRLRNKLRLANVRVDDLVVDPGAFKHKKREWWFTQGASYCDRLAAKFRAPNRDVLSKEMMDGTSLSPSECTAVVEDPLFEQWEAHLAAEDYKKAAALSSTQTKFGKSVTRGWIFFQEHAGSASAAKSAKLNPGDTHRPRLDAALLKMTQVWERHVQGTLKSSYPTSHTSEQGRAAYTQQETADVLAANRGADEAVVHTVERLPMGADGAVLMAADGAAVTPAAQPAPAGAAAAARGATPGPKLRQSSMDKWAAVPTKPKKDEDL